MIYRLFMLGAGQMYDLCSVPEMGIYGDLQFAIAKLSRKVELRPGGLERVYNKNARLL